MADAGQSQVDGLHRLRYFDKVAGTEQIDMTARLVPQGELDRIYFDAARPLTLNDGNRQLAISAQGFRDAVIWNPGTELARRLPDLPDDDWRGMLCIEAAAIGMPVEVLPGDCWIGRQTIDVVPPPVVAPA